MTERRQLREVCAWNRRLSRENSELRAELHRTRSENEALEAVNADLATQTEAAECFLGSAITEARRARR
jgi:cell division protein FtsB